MNRKQKKANATGRNAGPTEQHVRLSYHMLGHPNFRALNGASTKVLLALAVRHTGYNNGRIVASYDEIAQTQSMSKTTVSRACKQLEYYGFIKLRKRGHFYGRRANEWEITFVKSAGYHPTHDWKHEKPKRNRPSSQSKPSTAVDEIINLPEYAHQRQEKIKSGYQNETETSIMVSN